MHFKIPQKTIVLWEIRFSLLAVVFWGILFFYIEMNYTINLIFMFFVTIISFYMPFYLKSFEIYVKDKRIEIKSGIIIKTEYILPNKALIYGEAFTTPIAAKLDVFAVALKGVRKVIVIPELKKEDAEAILERIANRENAD